MSDDRSTYATQNNEDDPGGAAAHPKEVLEHLVTGPMTAEAVNATCMALKKALIERARIPELRSRLWSRCKTCFNPIMIGPNAPLMIEWDETGTLRRWQ